MSDQKCECWHVAECHGPGGCIETGCECGATLSAFEECDNTKTDREIAALREDLAASRARVEELERASDAEVARRVADALMVRDRATDQRANLLANLAHDLWTHLGGRAHHPDECPGNCVTCSLADRLDAALKPSAAKTEPLLPPQRRMTAEERAIYERNVSKLYEPVHCDCCVHAIGRPSAAKETT